MEPPGWVPYRATKGSTTSALLDILGTSAHSSDPASVVDAILRAVCFLAAQEEYQKQFQR
ncbi:Zn-dependent exopeptidase [Penicillium hetheringtonii]|uniref:Zn-dependent exopeptidase n=1 Tax=Penicillium hetheringtonii TaxID=911720 RepID=A0AAD6D9Q4_9EURO|nr:Zn-dependent exopeptidase [Penicillium hetheringtonii]